MKLPFICASLFAAAVALAVPNTAKAELDIDVNIGLPRPPAVIIGGGHDHHRDHGRWEGRHHRRDRDRDYGHHRGHGRDRDYDHRGHHGPRGYWKEVTVKTWVPGGWTTSYDRHGRECRVRERGRYVYHTDRVWVSRH